MVARLKLYEINHKDMISMFSVRKKIRDQIMGLNNYGRQLVSRKSYKCNNVRHSVRQ